MAKQEYSTIEIDFYPDEDSEYILKQYLESLKLMAKSINKSSEMGIDSGAGFFWKLKIEAKGQWS